MFKVILSTFLLFAVAFPALSQEHASPEPAPIPATHTRDSGFPRASLDSQRVPFTTVEQRQESRFSEDNAGMPPVFKDAETWKSFWDAYTAGRQSRPELPAVDFNSEMVIVSSRGAVSGVYLDRDEGVLRVVAKGRKPSNSSTPATDPLHIIKTEKLDFQSVVFERNKPAKEFGADENAHDGPDFDGAATRELLRQDFRVAAAACLYEYQWDEWTSWGGWRSYAEYDNYCSYGLWFWTDWVYASNGSCVYLPSGYYRWESRSGTAPYVYRIYSC